VLTYFLVGGAVQVLCVVMAKRHNTMVCSFDLSSPRITVYDIHGWIFDVLRIPEHTVKMNQNDDIKRHVYIKLADTEPVLALLWDTAGQAEYKYRQVSCQL
jgi:hypothetical protein